MTEQTKRYYKIALIAHVLPLEDNAAWRCYEDLKLAGHAVEVLDPNLYPGIINEAGEVNQKMIGPFLDKFKPDYVATEKDTAEGVLATLAKRDCGSDEPPRHFVLYGYVGKDNFGDELIFEILQKSLANRYSGSYVTLIGHGPATSLERHGVASLPAKAWAQISYSLNGASAMLFMAGLLFDIGFAKAGSGLIDLFQSQRDLPILSAITQLAYMNDVPVVYAGIGAGPLSNPDAQKLVKLASLTRPRYITRDEETSSLLLNAGVDRSLVSQKADLVFSLEKPHCTLETERWLSGANLESGGYIVVALRPWNDAPESMVASVAAALDHAYEQHSLRAVFIDFAPEDGGVHRTVLNFMKHPETSVLFGCATNTQLTLEVIAEARMAIAMRLHGSIIANAFGLPSIGLNYNDKVEAFYHQMQQDRLLLPLDCDDASVIEAIDSVQLACDELSAAIAEKATENHVLAKEALVELFEVIETGNPCCEKQILYQTVESAESEMLEAARIGLSEVNNQLRDAQCEVDKLKAEIERMKNTKAWNMGNALLRPLRILRKMRG